MKHALKAIALLMLISAGPATTPTTGAFPQSWLGRWKGDLSAETSRGNQSLKMELVIAATDDPKRFIWTIVYDSPAGRQERPYFLEAIDAKAGRYVIDEGNGIRLSAWLSHGDTLTSAFDVGESSLVATDRFDAEHGTIESQIVSYRRPATPATKPVEVVEGFGVTPFDVIAVQRATLRRN
jgi:hypothetical protein